MMMEENHAAVNLGKEWKYFCLKAMGLEDLNEDDDIIIKEDEESATTSDGTLSIRIFNLLRQEDEEQAALRLKEEEKAFTKQPDTWMATALQIRSNLYDMAAWIDTKQWDYVSVNMLPEEEASLIQSTVTSFVATTAKEIESLRTIILQSGGDSSSRRHGDVTQHRTGIVQWLLTLLQERIAQPFGKLQKQRNRTAVKLRQHPLTCQLALLLPSTTPVAAAKSSSSSLLVGGLILQATSASAGQADPRFVPQRPSHIVLQKNFLDSYNTKKRRSSAKRRPVSLFGRAAAEDCNKSSSTMTTAAAAAKQRSIIDNDDDQSHYTTTPQDLQAEAQLLTVMSRTSELESIQKMEQAMVSITTLLSQFSNLVAEQQQDVVDILDNTTSAKKNMEAGQDELVDATERTQQSKHLLASGIFAMACLLLLFHWLRP